MDHPDAAAEAQHIITCEIDYTDCARCERILFGLPEADTDRIMHIAHGLQNETAYLARWGA